MSKSVSIEAINLAKSAFSTMQGNFGLVKFSIETLEQNKRKSEIWDLVCTFYENLGSPLPSKYKAIIDTKKQTVSIKKLEGEIIERKFKVMEEELGTPSKISKAKIGKVPPVPKK
jgi:hypothetical protein